MQEALENQYIIQDLRNKKSETKKKKYKKHKAKILENNLDRRLTTYLISMVAWGVYLET